MYADLSGYLPFIHLDFLNYLFPAFNFVSKKFKFSYMGGK